MTVGLDYHINSDYSYCISWYLRYSCHMYYFIYWFISYYERSSLPV